MSSRCTWSPEGKIKINIFTTFLFACLAQDSLLKCPCNSCYLVIKRHNQYDIITAINRKELVQVWPHWFGLLSLGRFWINTRAAVSTWWQLSWAPLSSAREDSFCWPEAIELMINKLSVFLWRICITFVWPSRIFCINKTVPSTKPPGGYNQDSCR